mmetsp:Transcript_60493/g.112313  ORF Transcript_60493/g.112313 Transcript_60493/m.112313 type:complete len:240 (+) Transcript_60493:104-823(+)
MGATIPTSLKRKAEKQTDVSQWDEVALTRALRCASVTIPQSREERVAQVRICLEEAKAYSGTVLAKHWKQAKKTSKGQPMRLIFLDVDGVLNSDEDYYTPHYLDVAAMQRLARLLERVGNVFIVLSTTWRLNDVLKGKLMRSLANNGIPHSKIVGQTPNINQHNRTLEIKSWMQRNSVASLKAWVALDDMDLFAQDAMFMAGHFVHIDPHEGLQDHHADEAFRLLFMIPRSADLEQVTH